MIKYEKSCGAIIYRTKDDIVEYLAIKSRGCGHWSFPKGHVEKDETEQDTACREAYEETGLTISCKEGFRTSVQYSPKPDVLKEVIYFIAEINYGIVCIQADEVQAYKWLDFKAFLNLITYESDKDVLIKANNYMKDRGIEKY